MGYEIIAYTPELDAAIAQLQTHLWSEDAARNAAYLAWKYTHNPCAPEPMITLALSDGKLVGMRGLFGMLWEVDDAAVHPLPCPEDLVVLPEHRNRGVMSRIMHACLDDAARHGYRFAVSLSAGPVTYVSSLASGWRAPGSYQLMVRQPSMSPVLQGVRTLLRGRGLGRLAAALGRRFAPGPFAHLDRMNTGPGAVTVSRMPRPADMAALVARLAWDGRIRHVRDARYLAWRFQNPLHEYRFLFWDEGGLQGYLVLQRYLAKWADRTRVNIADWEGDERVRAALLAAALEHGRFAQLSTWSAGATESTRAVLHDAGFALAPADDVRGRSQGLLVRGLGEAAGGARWLLGRRDLLNIADWDLRMLYSMMA